MTMLDLLLGGIVGGSIIAGFVTGFTRTAFGILATVAGVLLGFWFYEVPSKLYRSFIGSEQAADLFGFFTVFLVTLAAGTLLGRTFQKAFKLVGLGFADRLGGALFGLLRGTFVAAAAVAVLLAATPRPVPNWMRGSKLLPYALGASDLAASIAPQGLKDSVSDSIAEIRQAWNGEVEKAKKRAEKALLPDAFAGEPEQEAKPVEIIPPAKTAKKPAPKTTAKKTTAKKKAPQDPK